MAAPRRPVVQLRLLGAEDTRAYEADTFHAVSLEAEEAISAPFVVRLEIVTTRRHVDPASMLGEKASMKILRGPDEFRYFNGLVAEYTTCNDVRGFSLGDRFRHRLTVVPNLWFLGQSADCRIFQDMTVTGIVEQILQKHAITNYALRVSGPNPVRAYTTQYNETDLRFVERILQEAGFFYFYTQTESDYLLVIADSNASFEFIPYPVHRIWDPGPDNMIDCIPTWNRSARTTFSDVELQDYNLYNPERPLTGIEQSGDPTGNVAGLAARPVFAWPAGTDDDTVVQARTRLRMQAAEVAADMRDGNAVDVGFTAGGKITITEDPLTGASGISHVLRTVRIVVKDESWLPDAGPGASWHCAFTCFPADRIWRDAPTLARPVMAGVCSALVVGDGGEIETDEYGRIKVRPLFQHRPYRAAPAIWVRVLHAWAGPLSHQPRGWQHIPRIGTEVGLAFADGNPDTPVVIGCFYNAMSTPPFELPGEARKQGFRSHTSLDGGYGAYNELSFDDTAEAENVYLRAQKDHRIDVLNDRNVTTKRDDTLTSTLGDITIEAETGSIAIQAATQITLTVGTTRVSLTEEAITLVTAGAFSATAGGVATVEAAGDANVSGGGAVTIEAVGAVNVDGGEVAIEADEGPVVAVPFPI